MLNSTRRIRTTRRPSPHADNDSREAELNARDDAISARERLHAVNVTKFVDFVGKASVLFDRLHKLRADQAEEALAAPPGHKSEEPDPMLQLEDFEVSGTSPGEPSEPEPKEVQEFEDDPHGEFLKLKAPISMDQSDPELPHPPVAAGLDKE